MCAPAGSLRKLAKDAHKHYTDRPRTTWVLEQPAQLVLVVSQMHWVAAMEARLSSGDASAGLQEFLQVCLLACCGMEVS